jgi:hypothetical protein
VALYAAGGHNGLPSAFIIAELDGITNRAGRPHCGMLRGFAADRESADSRSGRKRLELPVQLTLDAHVDLKVHELEIPNSEARKGRLPPLSADIPASGAVDVGGNVTLMPVTGRQRPGRLEHQDGAAG